MGKIKNFLNKPITYGTYLKWCGWSLGSTAAIYAAAWVYNLYTDRKYYMEKYYEEIGVIPDDNFETVVDEEVETE